VTHPAAQSITPCFGGRFSVCRFDLSYRLGIKEMAITLRKTCSKFVLLSSYNSLVNGRTLGIPLPLGRAGSLKILKAFSLKVICLFTSENLGVLS
jgi:hypothetical protein